MLFGSVATTLSLSTAVTTHAEELKVVTSFSILADMVDQIAGDEAAVTSLVGRNGDTHFFSPSPKDAQLLKDAELLVINGLEFEGWIARLIEASGFEGTLVVATDGITPISNDEHGDDDHHDEGEHHDDDEHHDEDEHYDEHRVTLDPGEALVLHSDGFEQAFPHDLASHQNRCLPNERYREVIANLGSHDGPEDMIRGVRDLLDGHGGSLHQPDDLTMICLRAAAEAGEAGIDEERDTIPFPIRDAG